MKRILLLVAVLLSPLALARPGDMDETRATLRAEALKLINRDRELMKVRPVELDLRVSAWADEYSRLQIRNGTAGHYSIEGLAPYIRYSFAGGDDGLTENTAAWSANYNFSERALYEMVRRSHDAMMGEMPPKDGHRRAILDPDATHVGIGLAWEGGEFRITQHFVRRYLRWSRTLPREATTWQKVTGAARPNGGYRVDTISVHHEPFPAPMTAAAANRIESYQLPDRRRDLRPRLKALTSVNRDGTLQVARQQYEDGSRGEFNVSEDGSFSFEVPFKEGPGIYTIVVWVRYGAAGPHIPASNVSIRVTEPATGSPKTLVR
jgi:uncharacterized protein YkwD